MTRVKVYRFARTHIVTSERIISTRMATKDWIARHGDLIEGSGIEIDRSELEPGEEFTPKNFRLLL